MRLEQWEMLTSEERELALADDLSNYIKDHYGICRAEVCGCLRTGWRGRNCPDWIPVKANNWQELIKENGG